MEYFDKLLICLLIYLFINTLVLLGILKQLIYVRKIMATMAEILARIDVASSAIAARFKAYMDKIASGTIVTPEELAALDNDVATLEAMGTEPVPVPDPVPTPEG